MHNDSISPASAAAIFALLVGREVEIRGEFGGIKVADDCPTLTGGGITEFEGESDDVVLRLEFHNGAVEMWDTSTGTSFGFGTGGLWCSMGPGDVNISVKPGAVAS